MPLEYGSHPVARLFHFTTETDVRIPERDILSIGRDADEAGFVVEPNIPGISRRHVEVYFRSDRRVVLKDVGTHGQGTPGGTFINGTRIDPLSEVVLNHNDEVRLGPLGGERFLFQDEVSYTRVDFQFRGGNLYVRNTPLHPELKPVEYRIFKLLFDRYPETVSVDQISVAGWGEDEAFEIEQRVIQKAVQRLRLRLNREFQGNSIEVVMKKGYRLKLFP